MVFHLTDNMFCNRAAAIRNDTVIDFTWSELDESKLNGNLCARLVMVDCDVKQSVLVSTDGRLSWQQSIRTLIRPMHI